MLVICKFPKSIVDHTNYPPGPHVARGPRVCDPCFRRFISWKGGSSTSWSTTELWRIATTNRHYANENIIRCPWLLVTYSLSQSFVNILNFFQNFFPISVSNAESSYGSRQQDVHNSQVCLLQNKSLFESLLQLTVNITWDNTWWRP